MLTTDELQTRNADVQSRLGSGILDRVGNTPLIRIDGLDDGIRGVAVLGKAEWVNPGGSVKDRAAKAIVLDGIERGLIGPGKKKHLLDATSGNTGIAYAMLGAAMGFPVTLVMPSNVSPERKQILAAYGVEIVWTIRQTAPMVRFARREKWPQTIRRRTGTPINIQTTITGVLTIEPRQMKSGNRPKAV